EVCVDTRVRFLGRNCQRENFLLRQVFEIFCHGPLPVINQGCEYYFFAAGGLGEATGAGATRTVVPVVRESDGLTITLSDSETPLRISDWIPKSRPTLTSRSCTTPLASTMPTCTLLPRNMSVLSGKVTSFPRATSGTRTVA